MKYLFAYSGAYEGTRGFRKLSALKRLINKIPEHELKNTVVMRWNGKFYHVGQYFILKRGGLSVRF